MLMKISKLYLSYLTKVVATHFRQKKKSSATFIFLSHFATMVIDSANPAGNQHVLLFPTMLSYFSQTEIISFATFNVLSTDTFSLDNVNILSFSKRLNL